MHAIDYVFVGCWIAFWVYWFAAAFRVKTATRTLTGRFLVPRIAIIILVIVLVRSGAFRGHSATVNNPWLIGIGTALFFLGLALAIWARVFLGRNWGMPMTEKADPELVTNGPYRSIRHPIYSGIILAMIGTALAIEWYWVFIAVLLGAYFIYSAVIEEQNMLRLFPTTYPQYKKRTKMLIPFVF
jgi:protein-S-isoprenylcysteine O-methyltransferase Ste14